MAIKHSTAKLMPQHQSNNLVFELVAYDYDSEYDATYSTCGIFRSEADALAWLQSHDGSTETTGRLVDDESAGLYGHFVSDEKFELRKRIIGVGAIYDEHEVVQRYGRQSEWSKCEKYQIYTTHVVERTELSAD